MFQCTSLRVTTDPMSFTCLCFHAFRLHNPMVQAVSCCNQKLHSHVGMLKLMDSCAIFGGDLMSPLPAEAIYPTNSLESSDQHPRILQWDGSWMSGLLSLPNCVHVCRVVPTVSRSFPWSRLWMLTMLHCLKCAILACSCALDSYAATGFDRLGSSGCRGVF